MAQPTALEKKQSLKNLVISGSVWTLIGYAAAQVLRLISNVILAKLLFPEAFGLMTLVTVFIQGISMFSDVGITPSIIQNKRGHEASFLNTAWTIQVIRGVVLWLISIVAAYPYSEIYNEPILAYMIPISGFTAVILGFNSTSLATANRDLNLRNITLLGLIAQLVSVIFMVVWVYISPSVWALVAGGIVNAVVRMTLSHLWISNQRNYFHWNSEDAKELFKFGKWIVLSTALTFFASQIDRLLLGYLLGASVLGVYTIAVMFKETTLKAIQMLSSKVLFPSYSKLINSGDDKRLYRALKKTRIILIASTWFVSIFLIFIGSYVIDLLYDDRYGDAIWMIKIMPLEALVGVLSLTYGNVYLARGKSSYITAILFLQLILQVTAILLGYHLNGVHGIIIGLTTIGWLLYPANVVAARRLKVWQPEVDIPVLAFAIIFTSIYLISHDFLMISS
nr:oligosaccharide flippase family protein [uncultured Methylophaga sp.]